MSIFALMIIVRNKYIPFPHFAAINLCGVLFCHHDVYLSQRLINHERIHTAQILEMGVIFFYLWYLGEWMVKLCSRGNAYFRISFEREAYRHEGDMDYLKHRKHYAWWKYMREKKRKPIIRIWKKRKKI